MRKIKIYSNTKAGKHVTVMTQNTIMKSENVHNRAPLKGGYAAKTKNYFDTAKEQRNTTVWKSFKL